MGRPEWGRDRLLSTRSADGDAYIESFNGRLPAKCLNASWFLPLADARESIEELRCHYNDNRPHTAPGGLTPRALANRAVTVEGTPSTTAPIAKGNKMPPYGSKSVI